MTWTPILTYLAATAGAAGLAYIVCVTWICVREKRSDRRAQRRVVWTPEENSR